MVFKERRFLEKENNEVIDEHRKKMFNFRISISIAAISLVLIGPMVFFIAIPVLVIVLVGFLIFTARIVFSIVGVVKAYQKKYYELPLKFELIKKLKTRMSEEELKLSDSKKIFLRGFFHERFFLN